MTLERFYELRKEMYMAFEAGELNDAESLANEFLNIAESWKSNWNYGNAIHQANLILGRIALKEGLKEKAKDHLLRAGKTPGSPQLNSGGPNMMLAKELLEIGEDKVVLEYLDLCKKFWYKLFSFFKIRQWKRSIRKGKIPDFKGNLVY